MSAYLLRRLGGVITVVIALLIFTFFATYAIGDPIALLVDPELSSDEEIAEIRSANGLDQPVWRQFVDYTGRVLHGDFGISLWHQRPATEVVLERLPATIQLALITIGVVTITALALAMLATWQHNRPIEHVIVFASTMLACVPSFWLALLLILLFAVNLSWLPTSGYGSWQNVVLPISALAAQPIGTMTQVMHTGMLNEVGQPYVGVARAKGLPERVLIWRHVLRNTTVLLMTVLGSMLAQMLNGAVLVETIFAWPGIGDLGLNAVHNRDLPVLTAVVFYSGITVTLINLVVDLVYVRLDPRVRLQ